MRRRTSSFLLTALALAGCGGSNHGDTSPVNAGTSYESGLQSLNSAINLTTNRSENFKAAQKSFDTAFGKNADDPRVAMGYAISTIALDATVLGDAVAGKGVAKRLAPLGGLGARLGLNSKTSLVALLPMLAARPRSRADGATVLAVVADLKKIVTRLTDTRLDALESNPLVLSGNGVVASSTKIGSVEGYALRSAVKAALGLIDGALAYNVDPGDYDPSALFLTRFSTQVAVGTVITPADYLPTGSFGTPATGAGLLLADLKTQWTGTADDGTTALARLGTRTGDGWLTDLVPLTDEDKASIASSLTEIKSALSGPTSVPITLPDGTATTLTVDLSVPLANPPADIRAFFPSLRPIPVPPPGTLPTTTLTPVQGSVADPTLGGLVPGGLPSPLLYGRTLNVDSETTQGEVAAWAFPLSGLADQ